MRRHYRRHMSPHSTAECDMDTHACRCTEDGEATFTRVIRCFGRAAFSPTRAAWYRSLRSRGDSPPVAVSHHPSGASAHGSLPRTFERRVATARGRRHCCRSVCGACGAARHGEARGAANDGTPCSARDDVAILRPRETGVRADDDAARARRAGRVAGTAPAHEMTDATRRARA